MAETPDNRAETESELQTLESVMAEYETGLLRYAARILNDPAAAQDVVQEAFIKLSRHWKNGDRPAPGLKGWLYRVAHNQAVDHIRRESRLKVLHQRQAETAERQTFAAPGADLDRRDALRLALEQLRRLTPEEQQVVILRLQEGMSYKEIAEVTHRSEGNVGCILHHAVKKISARLSQAGVR